ncbi:MAG: SDR family oxidoreductase [Cyclobacteriaceae bacterium]|nr:SDR family oxidoreductase [Cyclobacteriaceae bacterium]
MKIDLTNKRILVTGASRGIGKAIALQLQQSGARVAAHYQKNEQAARSLAEASDPEIHLFKADFNQPIQVAQLFEEVLDSLGGLDVLINNAGLATYSPLASPDPDWLGCWEHTLQVNLASAALLCKKAIPVFQKQQKGIIINISSRAAFRGDTPEYLAYAASKGGLVSLTRSLARAYGKEGIVAFNVAPGFVRTDMAQDFIDQYGEDRVVSDIALDELTQPEDVAPTIAFLASGMANHATGATIDINAGSYVH